MQTLWENWDILFFTGIILAGFAAKHLVFSVRQKKGMLRADLCFVAVLLPLTVWLVHDATRQEHLRLRQMLGGLVPMYAQETERLGHEQVGEATPENDATYLRLIAAQKRWLELNPAVADIYTVRLRGDGVAIFIINSESDLNGDGKITLPEEKRVPIGTLAAVSGEAYRRAFAGEPSFDETPANEHGGLRVAAWHPLRAQASSGVEAVLGVDYNAASWQRAIHHARFGVLATSGVFALLYGGFTTLLGLQRAHRQREREAMQALERSEERLALHLQHTPLAAIEWDLDFHAIQWNPSAERIFGFSAKEAIGRNGFDLIVPQTMHAFIRDVWIDLTKRGIPRATLQEGITKAGRAIVCECFHTPLINTEGKVIGVASLCQDITERRTLEEELRQSQKLQSVSSLASTSAHDFNNQLTVISGHADLIASQKSLPAEVIDSAQEIDNAVQGAVRLIRQLLAFSRKEKLAFCPVEINSLLERISRMVRPVLGPAIRLQISPGEGVPAVVADANSLEQAVINLILNARDAQPGGGEVRVSTVVEDIAQPPGGARFDVRAGTYVRLTVADMGPGIPKELLSRIFDPFFTTKPAGKGTGLGLAAIVRIMKDHRGWVDLESQPGKGACFHLFLPVVPTDGKAGAEAS